MQKGEEEVVSPKPGLVCEQVITYMDNSAVELYNSSNAADWICLFQFKSILVVCSAPKNLKNFRRNWRASNNTF